MSRAAPIFKLYGEQRWPTPDMVHCESIATRSRLHDWRIKPHRHHGLLQVLHLRRGHAVVQCDGQSRTLRSGQLVLVPQMCIHGFEFGADADGTVVTIAYPLIGKIDAGLADLCAKLDGAQFFQSARGARGRQYDTILSALGEAYASRGAQRQLLLESLLGVLLGWLAADWSAGPAAEPGVSRSAGPGHFEAFCRLVEMRYAEHQSVAAYARELGISAAHLNVVCRAAVNQSALDLIHQRLLLEAKRALVYTSMSVTLLSDSLGFADPAYFTRFFKRLTGTAPGVFRRQAGALP